jgi:energy-coupling factor transporter transmembrane protein EcfT
MCAREILPLTLSLIALYFGLAAVSVLAGMDTSEMRPTEFVVFAGRCVSAFLAFRALFVTTHHMDVVRALAKLKIPLLFVTVAGSIFRWLTLILDQAKNANNARLLRGGGLRSKPEQIRDLKHMSASLMLRSVAKADRIASAMECRGFSGRLVSPVAEAIPIRAIMPLVVLVGLIAIIWVVTS